MLGFCRAAVVSLGLFVFAVSCATPTSTTQLWSAESAGRAPMKRVVVFARGATDLGRRVLEDAFVAALGGRDVEAKPSYELFPRLTDPSSARATLEASGFDGALVATLQGAGERTSHVPGGKAPYPAGGPGISNGFYGGTWSPGYAVTDEVVDVETALWDLRANGVLVWAATTRTTNPRSTADAAKSVTKELVPKLAKAGFLR